MQTTSNIYPGLPITVDLMLWGVIIPTLKQFVSYLKLDEEFTLEEFLLLFDSKEDIYGRDILENAFLTTKAFPFKDIFSAKINNSELRRALIAQVGPKKLFSELAIEVRDSFTIKKTYPRYEIKGNVSVDTVKIINSLQLVETTVSRIERYELIEIVDERVIKELGRSRGNWRYANGIIPLIMLKMTCPSTGGEYFEYIHPDIAPRQGGSWKGTALSALLWQLRKHDGSSLTKEEYLSISSET